MTLNSQMEFTGHSGHVNKVRFCPGRETVFSLGFSGEVFEWDMKSNKLSKQYKGHSASVNEIRFLENGKFFLTAANDGKILKWKLNSTKPEKVVIEIKEPIQSLHVDAEELSLFFNTPKYMLAKVNLRTGITEYQIKAIGKNISLKAISEKDKAAYIGGAGTAIVKLSLEDGSEVGMNAVVSEACTSLALYESGKKALALNYFGDIVVIDNSLQKIGAIAAGKKGNAHSVALHGKEKMAVVSQDMALRLIDLRQGAEHSMLSLPSKGNYHVDFSLDGKWLGLASADKKVRLFKVFE